MDPATGHPVRSAAPGGKGLGLLRLREIAEVPPFGVLDASCFSDFLREHGLESLYDLYWEMASSEEAHRAEPVEDARTALIKGFLHLPLSDSAELMLADIFAEVTGPHLVARSSFSVEDGAAQSFAGQFFTQFAITSAAELREAVRVCWASSVRASLAAYVRGTGCWTPGSRWRMAVVVQTAIDAQTSGVVFSHDPAGEGEAAVVEATWGVGAPLVAGLLTPERWLAAEGEKACRTQWRGHGPVCVLPHGCLTEPGYAVLLKSGDGWVEARSDGGLTAEGLWSGHVAAAPEDQIGVLDAELATRLGRFAKERAKRAGRPLELEWTVDLAGRLWWLQERPVTVTARRAGTISPSPNGRHPLARGVVGSYGKIRGNGWWSEAPRAAPSPTDAILFQTTTTPGDVPVLRSVRGVATQDGGILSHTAIVCRELGVPCLVGTTPFPPAIDVARPLLLDAERGFLWSADTPDRPAASEQALPAVLFEKAPRQDRHPGIRWGCGEAVWKRIPEALQRTLRRIAQLPGVIGSVDVAADINHPHDHLGFPIGIAFLSERLHPTSVSDCGDGFRVCEIRGARAGDLLEARSEIVVAIREWLGPESPLGEPARGAATIDLLFCDGLRGLEDTEFAEPEPRRVEAGGRLAGGSAAALPAELRKLAEYCLGWHGEAGHFIEFLVPAAGIDSVEMDRSAAPALLFHTGSMELGLEFLKHAVRVGAPSAYEQGLDDRGSIQEGLWGLDPTTEAGRLLTSGAIGLTNYAFARRRILQVLVEKALKSVLGRRCSLDLLSDVVHTAVRIRGDGLLHQQGIQRLDSVPAEAPLVVAGAPRVASYLLRPLMRRRQEWCCHGKVNMGHLAELVRPREAQQVAGQVDVDGSTGADPVVADAQTREAVGILAESGLTQAISCLVPAICIRGRYNGRRKI